MTGIGDPEQLLVVRATPEFFGVVQTEPVARRLFVATEEQAAVVVLGYGLWQRKFGGNASAVGQILRLDSVPHTIIGVLPQSFQFPARDLDAWVPLQPSAEERSSGAFWLQTVGRLKPGVSLAQAQQEMTAIAARRREVAIRTALGASRRRVVRQLLTEAVILFVFGGVLGVALGSVLLRLVVTVAPPTLSWLRDVSLDGAMLAVALGMAAFTGVLFGVLPSWKAVGADVVEVVASGVKGAGRGGLSQGFRRALIVSQIAIATIVASAASLSFTSLVHAQRVGLLSILTRPSRT